MTYENAPTLPRDQLKAVKHARAMERLASEQQQNNNKNNPDDDTEQQQLKGPPTTKACQMLRHELRKGNLGKFLFFIVFAVIVLLTWVAFFNFFLG